MPPGDAAITLGCLKAGSLNYCTALLRFRMSEFEKGTLGAKITGPQDGRGFDVAAVRVGANGAASCEVLNPFDMILERPLKSPLCRSR